MFVVFPIREGHCAKKDNSRKMEPEVGGTHAPTPLGTVLLWFSSNIKTNLGPLRLWHRVIC